MTGNIYIKGNLYITDSMDTSQLKENGITIYVKEDCFFYSEKEKIKLKDDDVFIEDLFTKMDVNNIVVFDECIK